MSSRRRLSPASSSSHILETVSWSIYSSQSLDYFDHLNDVWKSDFSLSATGPNPYDGVAARGENGAASDPTNSITNVRVDVQGRSGSTTSIHSREQLHRFNIGLRNLCSALGVASVESNASKVLLRMV